MTLKLKLTPTQKEELEDVVTRHPTPYVRERAAALLKVASGLSARKVALERLLIERKPDTVVGWVKDFKTRGMDALTMQPGRGRKPASPP